MRLAIHEVAPTNFSLLLVEHYVNRCYVYTKFHSKNKDLPLYVWISSVQMSEVLNDTNV